MKAVTEGRESSREEGRTGMAGDWKEEQKQIENWRG